MTAVARAMQSVSTEPNTGCWLWIGASTGPATHQYGAMKVGSKMVKVHRLLFEATYGAIPRGKVLDHICRTTLCVNPSHLRICTVRENTIWGVGPTAKNAAKTHCVKGHALTPENTRMRKREGAMRRECKACQLVHVRKYALKKAGHNG
jgi:hypothetical protein